MDCIITGSSSALTSSSLTLPDPQASTRSHEQKYTPWLLVTARDAEHAELRLAAFESCADWFASPADDVVVLFMTQLLFNQKYPFGADLRRLVYQSIEGE